MTQSLEMTRDYSRLVVYQTGTSPADFAWEKPQKLLRFVQRGRILLRCGSAFALSLPSLGVSSLDLGRLFTQAALFSWVLSFRQGSERPDVKCPLRCATRSIGK